MKRRKKVLMITIALLLLAIVVALGTYQWFHYDAMSDYYPAMDVVERQAFYEIGDSTTALIFYQGGMVSTDAYLPICDRLAAAGIKVFLVKSPFDLAIIDQDNISSIVDSHPDVERWYVAGHSLGGAVAWMDAVENKVDIEGIFLLASYGNIGDDVSFDVTTIYGSNDQIMDLEKYGAFRQAYPHKEYRIEGGNHSGFGNYGHQKNDGMRSISLLEQHEEASRIMVESIFPTMDEEVAAWRVRMQDDFFLSMKQCFFMKEAHHVDVDIVAIGDLIYHTPLIHHAWTGSEYDFTPSFETIKPFIENSDYAFCTLEGAIAGPKHGYSGYPSFNGPDAILDAIKDAGFDGINLASNHINDRGRLGFDVTVEKIEDRALDVLGSKTDTNNQRYTIFEKDNVKIGIISYAYESGVYQGQVAINGVPISDDFAEQINTFSYLDFDNEVTMMVNEVKALEEITDAIVFIAHWGNEYHRAPNNYQRYMAEEIAKAGVDVIAGSHPHVVQPHDWIETERGKTLCFYAMGNFLSNQAVETLGESFTTSEDGTLNAIKLSFTNNELVAIRFDVEPTWVNRFATVDGRLKYEILPVAHELSNIEESNYSNFIKWRLEKSHLNYLDIKNKSTDTNIWVKDT